MKNLQLTCTFKMPRQLSEADERRLLEGVIEFVLDELWEPGAARDAEFPKNFKAQVSAKDGCKWVETNYMERES